MSARRSVPRARRMHLVALAVAAGVTVTACGGPTAGPSGPSKQERLVALRAAAALPGCPAGLGSALPDLELPCLSGGPDVSIRHPGPGTPMLVNVWGTWCGPCVREVPLLVDALSGAQGRLALVGVLTEDTVDNGLEFARQFGMNYTSVVDDDGVVMRNFSPGPPVTLFLGGDGKIRHIRRGEFKNAAELRRLVDQYLGVRLDPAGAAGTHG